MNASLSESLVQFFNEHDIRFSEERPGQCYHFGISHEEINYQVFTAVEENPHALTVLCGLPIMVPPLRRSEGLRLVNRLNRGTRFGSWSLDETDGELNLRLFQLVPEEGEPKLLIGATIAIATFICNQQARALIQFALGNLSASEAEQSLADDEEISEEDAEEIDFSTLPPEPPDRFGLN